MSLFATVPQSSELPSESTTQVSHFANPSRPQFMLPRGVLSERVKPRSSEWLLGSDRRRRPSVPGGCRSGSPANRRRRCQTYREDIRRFWESLMRMSLWVEIPSLISTVVPVLGTRAASSSVSEAGISWSVRPDLMVRYTLTEMACRLPELGEPGACSETPGSASRRWSTFRRTAPPVRGGPSLLPLCLRVCSPAQGS